MWSTKCRACVLCTCTSMCVQQFCVRSLQGCEIAAVLLWGWQCVQLRRLDWARWRLQTTQEWMTGMAGGVVLWLCGSLAGRLAVLWSTARLSAKLAKVPPPTQLLRERQKEPRTEDRRYGKKG